jgi:hypothetical protein
MAMIKLPGVGNTPVSKLKYADFTNPKVTEAYLDQFKTVNASISKINKNFNINHLSENGKIELAKELHKITKDGIVDPAKQEEHFLKAVTDITYKDKVYSALDYSSKSAAKSYITANPVKVYEDTPEPTLRERRDDIDKKLKNPELTDAEKKHLTGELEYLNKTLAKKPEDIQTEINDALVRKSTAKDPNKIIEIENEIIRLEARKADIREQQIADDTKADAEIKNQISKLTAEAIPPAGLSEGTTINTIKEDLQALEAKYNKQKEQLEKKIEEKGETTDEDLEALDVAEEAFKSKKNVLNRQLKAYQNYESKQELIGQLRNMTPENRAKLADELKVKDVNELGETLKNEESKLEKFKGNPEIQGIIQRNVDNIQKTINTKNLLQSVANNTELKPTQKDYIQTQITSAMTVNDVNKLKGKVKVDKELNYLLQKQQLTRLREEAKREKGEAKGRLSAARAEVQTKGFLTRVKRKIVSAPDVKKAKRDIKEQRAQSAFLGRAERAWNPDTQMYKAGKIWTRKVTANNLQKRLEAQQKQRRKNENERQRLKMLEELKQKFPIESNAGLTQLTKYMKRRDTPSRPGLTEGTFVDPNATPKIKGEPEVTIKEGGPARELEFVKKPRKPYTPEQMEAFTARRTAAREAEAAALKYLKPLNTNLKVESSENAPVKKPDPTVVEAEQTVVKGDPPVVKVEQPVVKADPPVVKADPPVVNQPEQAKNKPSRSWSLLKSKKVPLQTPEMVKRQKDVLDVWTNALRESKGNPVILKKTTPNVLKLLGTNPNTKELTNMIKSATALQTTKANIEKRLNLLTKSAGKSPQPQYIAGLQKQLEEIKVKEQAIDTKIQEVQQQFSDIAGQAPVEQQQQLTKKQQAQEQKKQKELQKIKETVEQLKFNQKLKDMINTPLPKAKDLKNEFNTFNPQQPTFAGISNPKINQFEKKKLDELQAANKAAENMINSSNLPPNKKEELKKLVNQKNLLKAAEIRDWAKTIT